MDKPAILSNPEAFVVVPAVPVAWQQKTIHAYQWHGSGSDWRHCSDKRAKIIILEGRAPETPLLESKVRPLYARPDPTALSDIAAYCAELEARLAEAERVIDYCKKRATGTVIMGQSREMLGERTRHLEKDIRDACTRKENGNG